MRNLFLLLTLSLLVLSTAASQAADEGSEAPVGPRKPPADLPAGLSRRGDIWYFVSERASFAVDGRNGMLAGLWDRASSTRCVAASVDEENRIVRLEVIADKPCEIIAWWPPPWGAARVEITGPQPQTLASVPAESYVTYGQERFVRLSLPKGESSVVLREAN